MKRAAESDVDALKAQVDQEAQEETKGAPNEGKPGESKPSEKGPSGKPDFTKKVRVCMLVGYNGMEFCGSQKNQNVRTVESELEEALHKMGMISGFNFGELKKIGWGRATRTDKRVHALQNTFSAKLLISKDPKRPPAEGETEAKSISVDEHLEDLRFKLNMTVPDDIRVFSMFVVSNRFNAKNCVSYREYSYFLPTFMLTPVSSLYLATPVREATPEEKQEQAAA